MPPPLDKLKTSYLALIPKSEWLNHWFTHFPDNTLAHYRDWFYSFIWYTTHFLDSHFFRTTHSIEFPSVLQNSFSRWLFFQNTHVSFSRFFSDLILTLCKLIFSKREMLYDLLRITELGFIWVLTLFEYPNFTKIGSDSIQKTIRFPLRSTNLRTLLLRWP